MHTARVHWREALMEALGLGLFMMSAEVHVRLARSRRAGCAKLAHSFPCIFCGEDAPG